VDLDNYYLGRAVPQDIIRAHMWLNIAASLGNKTAVKKRDLIAGMMTPAQIAEALKLARERIHKKYKGC
jgi:TPR repeat protein